jgi:altronate hydrolase
LYLFLFLNKIAATESIHSSANTMSTTIANRVLKIHPNDNVLVALQDLVKDEIILFNNNEYHLINNIPAKHKFFIKNLSAGDEIIMYGVLVGKVQHNVLAGELMTTENTKHAAEDFAYRNKQYTWQAPDVSRFQYRTFNGYHRNNGKVGTANYWLFIPTVFCENRNLDVIKEALHHELGYAVTDKYRKYTHHLVNAFKEGRNTDTMNGALQLSAIPNDRLFKNIDGIKFLNHNGGCGGTRQDATTLGKLLAAYVDHANVAGITILSLGCQHLQVADLLNEIKNRNPKFNKPVLIFEQQQSISEEDLIKQSIRETFIQLIEANKTERQPAGLHKLCIGVKCGGSDGFSGISANPAVGYCADMVVALGGTVLLAEFPELCGVEQELIDRCENEQSAQKFINLMKSYNNLAHAVGSGFHMNPSPGNIKDGLITDAIKSAGACKKGGTAPVTDVLDYTEPATKAGLNLVCTPGNDVEATTGKAAAGANLILFTTGLGTPTGNPICPVIKVATNTALAKRMSDIIDIDTGAIIEGTKTIEEMGEEILEFCIKAASGEIIPKAVQLNQDDFIPWKRGVSL